MKKNDVTIGTVYRAKVSDKLTDVRIDAENASGGWDATNLATKKKVRIKSAQRLRAAAMTKPQAKAVAAADQENARVRDERKASADGKTDSERAMARSARGKRIAESGTLELDGMTASERALTKAAKTTKATRANTAATAAKGKARAATGARTAKAATRAKRGGDGAPAKEKRTSLLDWAAQILAKAKEPMGCKDIVEKALAGGWTTNGQTPGATLYAAMTREIAAKGKDARFVKVDRGRFQLSGRKGA